MIGIRFKIPNLYNNYLYKILDNISSNNYYWKIVEEDIIYNNTEELLNKEWYDNKEFRQIISYENYYLMFLNVQGFYKSKDNIDILNYETFKNSNCQIIMIVVDSIFVDMYIKSETDLKIIYDNAVRNNFKDIEYIKNDNSKRNIFVAK